MHQANRNLIARVAQSLDVPKGCFFSNIERYRNTSSASMLIAAAEWRFARTDRRRTGKNPPAPLLHPGGREASKFACGTWYDNALERRSARILIDLCRR